MVRLMKLHSELSLQLKKEINLQVGELLSGAPYFTDFKPGLAISKVITTEWATYSYKFTMNQLKKTTVVVSYLN